MSQSGDVFEELMEFGITDEEIKSTALISPDLQEKINKWTDRSLTNPLYDKVKRCEVEHIDMFKTLEDFEKEYPDNAGDEDIGQYSKAVQMFNEHTKIMKANREKCPNFMSCPLFISNTLPKNKPCPLEAYKASKIKKAIHEEMQIEPTDYSDILTVNHLIMAEMLAGRALEGLSFEGLKEKVITRGKDGKVTYDTKPNEYFKIYQDCLKMKDGLNKSLVLGRENKLKFKQAEKQFNEKEVREEILKGINSFEKVIDVAEIVNQVTRAKDEEFLDIEG